MNQGTPSLLRPIRDEGARVVGGALLLIFVVLVVFHEVPDNTFHFDDAQEVLTRALEIKPTDALTHNQLGNIFLLEGDLETASEHYETALESKPDLPEPLFNLGLINEKPGNPGSALDYYQRFVESAAQIPFLETGVRTARDRIRSIEARLRTE